MNKTQILPTILIIIDVISGLVYLNNGDVRKTIYWIAAAILTASVTF